MSLKNSLMLTLTIVSIFLLLFFVVFGENGLVDLNRLRTEKNRLLQKNEELKQENISLYREIERLKNDPKYVENVARQELGVIGKDEVIIQVKKPKKADQN